MLVIERIMFRKKYSLTRSSWPNINEPVLTLKMTLAEDEGHHRSMEDLLDCADEHSSPASPHLDAIVQVDQQEAYSQTSLNTHSVTRQELNTQSVTRQELNTQSVTRQENTHRVTKKKLNTPSVTKEELNTHSVTKKELNTHSVTKEELNTHSVTKKELNTPLVTKEELNTHSVTKKELNTQSVTKKELNTPSVTKKELNTHSVTKKELNTHSVIKEELNTHSVTKKELNTQSVTKKELNTHSVTKEEFNTHSVTKKELNTQLINKEELVEEAVPTWVSDTRSDRSDVLPDLTERNSLYLQDNDRFQESHQSLLNDDIDQTDMIPNGSVYKVFSDLWSDLPSDLHTDLWSDLPSDLHTDLILQQTQPWVYEDTGDSIRRESGDDEVFNFSTEQTLVASPVLASSTSSAFRETGTDSESLDDSRRSSAEQLHGGDESLIEMMFGQSSGDQVLSSNDDKLFFDPRVHQEIAQIQANIVSSYGSSTDRMLVIGASLEVEAGDHSAFKYPNVGISMPVLADRILAVDLENEDEDQKDSKNIKLSRLLQRQNEIEEEEEDDKKSSSSDVTSDIPPRDHLYEELSSPEADKTSNKARRPLGFETNESVLGRIQNYKIKTTDDEHTLKKAHTSSPLISDDRTDSSGSSESLDGGTNPPVEVGLFPTVTALQLKQHQFKETLRSKGVLYRPSRAVVPPVMLLYEPDLQLPDEESKPPFCAADEKFTKMEMKRQAAIWDLISTEKQYVKRLKIMQQIFVGLLTRDLKYTEDQTGKLFPRLDELAELHSNFLNQLLNRQARNEDKSVDTIGDILLDQFKGKAADKMKSIYGVFCSKHTEAIQLYKELAKNDRKFQTFIKYCNSLPVCGKQEVSDFILSVTFRLTKYPILIEAIQTNTKDKRERGNLVQAFDSCRDVVRTVNEKIAAYEMLLYIQKKMDSKTVTYKDRKFKRQDLNANKRELLHAGKIGWRSTGGRVYDVLAVVLTDIIVFLQTTEQKYTFLTLDKKSCVVPVHNLVVRKDASDSHSIFIISHANRAAPVMYMLVCQNKTERKKWITILEDAIKVTSVNVEPEVWPAVKSGVTLSYKGENYRKIERAKKIQQIIEELHRKDKIIKEHCDEKNKLMQELLEMSTSLSKTGSSTGSQEIDSFSDSIETVYAAIQEASHLAELLHGTDTQMGRFISSYSEQQSNSYVPITVPKRSETFSGFDTKHDPSKLSGINQRLGSEQWNGQVPSTDISHRYPVHRNTNFSQRQDTLQSSNFEGDTQLRKKSNMSVVSSNQGSLEDLDEASVSTPLPLASSNEQMTSIFHLVQYLNILLNLTCSQSTKIESLRAELAEAKEEICKLSTDMPSRHLEPHLDQMEELQNLQESISQEKQKWEIIKRHDKEKFENEWSEIEKEQLMLRNHKETIKREQEILQSQVNMMSGQLFKMSEPFENNPEVEIEKMKISSSLQEKKPIVHFKSASVDFYDTEPLIDEDNNKRFPQYLWETSWVSNQSDLKNDNLRNQDSSSSSSNEQVDFSFRLMNSEDNFTDESDQILSSEASELDNITTIPLQQNSTLDVEPASYSVLTPLIAHPNLPGMSRSNSMTAAFRAAWKPQKKSSLATDDLSQMSKFSEPKLQSVSSAQSELNSRSSPVTTTSLSSSQRGNAQESPRAVPITSLSASQRGNAQEGPRAVPSTSLFASQRGNVQEGSRAVPSTSLSASQRGNVQEGSRAVPSTSLSASQRGNAQEGPRAVPITSLSSSQRGNAQEGPRAVPSTSLSASQRGNAQEGPRAVPSTSLSASQRGNAQEGPRAVPITSLSSSQRGNAQEGPRAVPSTSLSASQRGNSQEGSRAQEPKKRIQRTLFL